MSGDNLSQLMFQFVIEKQNYCDAVQALKVYALKSVIQGLLCGCCTIYEIQSHIR